MPHFTNVAITVIRHLLGRRHVTIKRFEITKQGDDRFDARVLLRQFPKFILLGDDVGIGEQTGKLLEAVAYRFKLVSY